MDAVPTVVVVDDDVAILECVGDCLARKEDLNVVGYASHAQAGVALALQCRPNAVLLDIHMSGADAFWACRQIVDQLADCTKVLFYTGFPRDAYLDRCLAAGGSGMVSKHSETIAGVALAIRHVVAGNTYFSPEFARRLIAVESGAPRSRLASLTHREVEVLRQLCLGRSNREIAASLSLSLRSVEKEVSDLKAKLEMQTINQLLIFAANEGLVFPELILQPDVATNSI